MCVGVGVDTPGGPRDNANNSEGLQLMSQRQAGRKDDKTKGREGARHSDERINKDNDAYESKRALALKREGEVTQES